MVFTQMVMIRVLTTSEVYYAVYDRFIAQDAERYPALTKIARKLRFVDLLDQYAATIDTSNRIRTAIYPCDFLGISRGVDTIDFADERLYTMFILTCT